MSIWQYRDLNKTVLKKHQLSLNEGDTPCNTCQSLSQKLHVKTLYIKREDQNPTGSFKDRQIAYQLSYHLSKGIYTFVLSSSGNAAISLIAYGFKTEAMFDIFISASIDTSKLRRLEDVFKKNITPSSSQRIFHNNNVTLHFSKKPRSDAVKFSQKTKAFNLRGSLDSMATYGYKTIAYELIKQCPKADAIFLPTSSGTSTVGIFEGYKSQKTFIPQFHIVQTSRIHPIAQEFDKDFKPEKTSMAMAICDKVALRKESVENIIEKTGGSGWVIGDHEIQNAQTVAKNECQLNISADSALSLAGLVKALSAGEKITKPILLLTGK